MATQVPHYVTYKVITEQDLEWHTRDGWKLQEVLRESQVHKSSDQVPVVHQNSGGGGSYTSSAYAEHSHVVQTNRFLVSRPSDSPVSLKEAQVVDLKGKIAVMEDQLRDAKREAEKKDKEIATLKTDLASSQERVISNYKSFKESEEMKRKMEGDLAKIQNAIGGLKMKEILAS